MTRRGFIGLLARMALTGAAAALFTAAPVSIELDRSSAAYPDATPIGTRIDFLIGSPARAQSFDPHIGSGNLTTTVEPGGIYVPSSAGVCEVRRVQYSDAFGWRVRKVLVCCRQGRCSSRLTA